METLAEYVKRTMDEKGLSSREVVVRSGNKIAASYITKIINGKTTNLSIEKAQALAAGLGVDEDELFRVARGIPLKDSGKRGGDPWPSNVLVRAIERITASPELTRIVKKLLTLKSSKLKALLSQLEKE